MMYTKNINELLFLVCNTVLYNVLFSITETEALYTTVYNVHSLCTPSDRSEREHDDKNYFSSRFMFIVKTSCMNKKIQVSQPINGLRNSSRSLTIKILL